MFIGIRDIRFAKGRFALISGVIAMMTLMVVALSALTSGLQDQSISAVRRLPGTSIVLGAPSPGQQPSLTDNGMDRQTVEQVVDEGHGGAEELGVATARITSATSAAAVTLFGATGRLVPAPDNGTRPSDDGVMLGSAQAEALGVDVGAVVTVGETRLRVTGIGETGSFAHTPVAFMTLRTWQSATHSDQISAVVFDGAAPDVAGTVTLPMSSATDAVPGYSSEHGSLLAMQLLLLLISALVVGAFFAVWTIQRLRDLAVVRALGAGRAYLFRDGLGQALIVIIAGEGIGAGAALLLLTAVSDVVPVGVTALTVMGPVLVLAVLGAVGAALAIRRVTTVDPVVALSR